MRKLKGNWNSIVSNVVGLSMNTQTVREIQKYLDQVEFEEEEEEEESVREVSVTEEEEDIKEVSLQEEKIE